MTFWPWPVTFRAILVFRTDCPSRIRDVDSPRSNYRSIIDGIVQVCTSLRQSLCCYCSGRRVIDATRSAGRRLCRQSVFPRSRRADVSTMVSPGARRRSAASQSDPGVLRRSSVEHDVRISFIGRSLRPVGWPAGRRPVQWTISLHYSRQQSLPDELPCLRRLHAGQLHLCTKWALLPVRQVNLYIERGRR